MQVANVSWWIVWPKGVSGVEFSYEKIKFLIQTLITNEKYPNVLGRYVLGVLHLNWKCYFMFDD